MTNQMKHDEGLERLRGILRSAVPPMQDAELQRDLWPRMLRRMETESARSSWSFQVPWFDWALLALAGAATVFFPALIPALLYHL